MADAVKTIKGITPEVDAKLKDLGVLHIDDLLEAGSTPHKRKELAGKIGIDPKALLELLQPR